MPKSVSVAGAASPGIPADVVPSREGAPGDSAWFPCVTALRPSRAGIGVSRPHAVSPPTLRVVDRSARGTDDAMRPGARNPSWRQPRRAPRRPAPWWLVLGTDAGDTVIVSGIIRLAHGLGLHVIAEGVAVPDHLEQLRELGCEPAQGFGVARPASADDVAALIRDSLPVDPLRATG